MALIFLALVGLGLLAIGVFGKNAIILMLALFPWVALGIYSRNETATLGDATDPIAALCFLAVLVCIVLSSIQFMSGRTQTEGADPEPDMMTEAGHRKALSRTVKKARKGRLQEGDVF